jgi:hypothetical protein
MANRTASYDKSYVGSSQPGLKSDNLRKREQARVEARTYRLAIKAGLSPKLAAKMVAKTTIDGIAAGRNPLAYQEIKDQLLQETHDLVVGTRGRVMAIRERNARGKVAA